jgi:DNA-binding CsgD family transcriptional regulator
MSQGAAIGIVYAARHPERVSHLVLCGGFVRGWADQRDDLLRRYDMDIELIRFGWDRADPSYRQVFSTQFMPDAPIEAVQRFNDHMPIASSAETAAALYSKLRNLDVRDAARQVRCPTLVLHGRGDLRVPLEEGRLIAGLVPGARFVTLETRNHLMMQDEPAWRVFLDTLAEFYPPGPAARATNIFPSLTGREREVLELIAQGLDNAQIAARLEISEKTVRNNITHIFDKIGVENRSRAIVLAREGGLGKDRQR